jgi:hypothetical protein
VNAGWPNNAATVLRNRSGDCKEHAILMVALLAAKGISSELVLVNASASYTLEPPGIPAFDHMMLYLPEFGIYTDPTASLAPFGVLAAETYDKPVMHFSAEGARIARTPAMRADEHVTINRTTITVAADGTIRGRTIEQSTGIFATYARSFATTIPIKGSEKAAADQLKLNGTPGTGRYEVPALNAPGSPWIVTGEFKLDAPYKATPGPQVIPVGLATRGRPGSFLFGARHPDRTSPFVCFAGRQVEEIDIEFADGLPLPVVAKDRTIKTGVFTYTSDAKLEGRTLRIRREFVSRVAGQVCAAELEAELAPALKTVSTNVQSRLQVAAPN